MFTLSALPLPSAAMPSAVTASAAVPFAGQPLDSAGIPAETGDTPPALSFDALLALQATAPLDATPAPPPPAIPAKALQQTGKILPDPATTLAALLPQAAASATDEATVTDATEDAAAPTTSTTLAPVLPDPAMIAAIFTAPQRLATALAATASTSTSPQNAPQGATRPQTRQAIMPTATATVALARTAVIEQATTFVAPLTQQQPVESPASHAPAAHAPVATAQMVGAPTISASTISAQAKTDQEETEQAMTRQAVPPQSPEAARPVVSHVRARTEPSDAAPTVTTQPLAEGADMPADAAPAPGLAASDTAVPTFAATTETAPDKTPAASSVRAEARPERIDFATLVDTLNRAREDASPRSINVAVTNTDFGRVSLRFDQDDSGLSVAMSSADPGFARAVTATAEAANTGNTQQDAQPKPQTGTTAQGDASRQQSQQHNPQQAERAAPATSARNLQGLPPGQDEPATDSGIYA